MLLTFDKPHSLSQLHDELLAAFPALRPTASGPVMRVEGRGDQIMLTVPDDADETGIANIVTSHVARPPASPPNFRALMDEIEGVDLDAPTTLVQIKAALKVLKQKQVAFMKARAGL